MQKSSTKYQQMKFSIIRRNKRLSQQLKINVIYTTDKRRKTTQSFKSIVKKHATKFIHDESLSKLGIKGNYLDLMKCIKENMCIILNGECFPTKIRNKKQGYPPPPPHTHTPPSPLYSTWYSKSQSMQQEIEAQILEKKKKKKKNQETYQSLAMYEPYLHSTSKINFFKQIKNKLD